MVIDLPYMNEQISGLVIEQPQHKGINLTDVTCIATDMSNSILRFRPVRGVQQGLNLVQRFVGFTIHRRSYRRQLPGPDFGETIIFSAKELYQIAYSHRISQTL